MSVKVISWGHTMKKTKGGRGGVAEVFLFSLSCQAFIIISSTSCKHQMPQTSATSTVSGQPPSAPWDICIYFLSPGSHCSPSICWRWLGSCLLGLIAASQSCRRFVFMAFFLYLPLALLPWWSDGLTDFRRWDTTADNGTPITIILLASFDCFPHGGCG